MGLASDDKLVWLLDFSFVFSTTHPQIKLELEGLKFDPEFFERYLKEEKIIEVSFLMIYGKILPEERESFHGVLAAEPTRYLAFLHCLAYLELRSFKIGSLGLCLI